MKEPKRFFFHFYLTLKINLNNKLLQTQSTLENTKKIYGGINAQLIEELPILTLKSSKALDLCLKRFLYLLQNLFGTFDQNFKILKKVLSIEAHLKNA